jgi:hypothetical protein
MIGRVIKFFFVHDTNKDSLFYSEKLNVGENYSVLGLKSISSGKYKILLACKAE